MYVPDLESNFAIAITGMSLYGFSSCSNCTDAKGFVQNKRKNKNKLRRYIHNEQTNLEFEIT
jgi:hypothetical protein